MAWSTFATGVNPARHNMFDFLNRNLRHLHAGTLLRPRHATRTRAAASGKYRIPLSRPSSKCARKSRTFWQILGEHQIASTILRVPITFPPEKFNGRMLSAMCTPDLLGTQGTFALYTTRTDRRVHGKRQPLSAVGQDGAWHGQIDGPRNHMEEGAGAMQIPFTLTPNGKRAALNIGDERHELVEGEYTPWITLTLQAALGIKVRGIARFLLTETEPELSLYSPPSTSTPKTPRCPSRTPGTTPPTWRNCWARIHPGDGRGHLGAQRARHR